MHLKRMEAYGFKSFADKLRLDFTTGVTCIVGPNGCGKSNVCDAIKWVLGEQNARNIRSGGQGKTMQEVIFKGTSNRKSMGFCEVSLVFDNKDRAYAIDEDELSITRKLYRSGDSEYYINGRRAKLKQIIDLFRDTGIGKDGYSVVGQGQIDAILSAKPEDRRQIFEEAAGISKYKANRKEAFVRLEKALQNVRTHEEQMHILEEVMKPLRRDAEIAVKARGLEERIRSLDINHFLYVADHSEEQREKLNEKLGRESEELTQTMSRQNQVSSVYADTQRQIAELDEESKRLNEEKVRLSVEEAKRASDGAHLSESLEKANVSIEKYTEEIEVKERELTENRDILAKSIEVQAEKIEDFEQAKREESEVLRKYTEIGEAVAVKQNEIDLTNKELLSSADKSGELNTDIAVLKAQKSALEENIARRENEIKEHTAGIKQCEKELETLDAQISERREEVQKKVGEQKALQVKYDELVAKLDEAEAKVKESIGTIANLKGRLNMAEINRSGYNNYDRAVKYLMTSSDPSIRRSICDVLGNALKASAPKFATAIDIALGGNVNNIITDTEKDAAFLIGKLKETGAGRATFLPLERMHPHLLEAMYETALDEDGCYGLASDLVRFDEKYRPAVETFLGKVVVVENLDIAIKMSKKYRYGFRIVTLEGENVAINGSLSGGTKGANENSALSLDKEIEELKRQMKLKEKEASIYEQEAKEGAEKKKELTTGITVLSSIISKKQSEIEVLEKQKLYLAQTKARHGFDIDRLKSENNADVQSKAGKEAQIVVQSAQTKSETDKRTGNSDALTALADALNRLRAELATADGERTRLAKKCKDLELELSGLKSTISGAQGNIDRLTTEILDAKSLLENTKTERENLLAEIHNIAALAGESEELKSVSKAIEELDSKKADLNRIMDEKYKEAQELSDKVSQISDRKARTETQLENIEKELTSLRDGIRENYHLSPEEAEEYRLDDYSDTAGVTENKSLRRELLALGPINAKAEESLAEHQKNYDEIKVHYDDIVQSSKMLEDTINDLTEKMESNFTDSFAKIQKNFTEIFNLLFDGGKGQLTLELMPGQSVLDAGIIIEAEPPGKKLQNITLLSGGERALTAIAIIFAIIKLHPMPFCVLDEVDAPLDDSNAAIYARFLQKYSRNTQFIIISHRKPTMELADELYGITMQEQGVSKHLSIKLSDALRMAHKGDS